MKNRYFIVYYVATSMDINGYTIGDTSFQTKGMFLNRKETIKQIHDINPHFKNIVITGITELNKKDYKKWILK